MDQTVNLTAQAFGGSNPPLTTSIKPSVCEPILIPHVGGGFVKRGFEGKDCFPPRLSITCEGKDILKGNHWVSL
jgi:hypothetical protein